MDCLTTLNSECSAKTKSQAFQMRVTHSVFISQVQPWKAAASASTPVRHQGPCSRLPWPLDSMEWQDKAHQGHFCRQRLDTSSKQRMQSRQLQLGPAATDTGLTGQVQSTPWNTNNTSANDWCNMRASDSQHRNPSDYIVRPTSKHQHELTGTCHFQALPGPAGPPSRMWTITSNTTVQTWCATHANAQELRCPRDAGLIPKGKALEGPTPSPFPVPWSSIFQQMHDRRTSVARNALLDPSPALDKSTAGNNHALSDFKPQGPSPRDANNGHAFAALAGHYNYTAYLCATHSRNSHALSGQHNRGRTRYCIDSAFQLLWANKCRDGLTHYSSPHWRHCSWTPTTHLAPNHDIVVPCGPQCNDVEPFHGHLASSASSPSDPDRTNRFACLSECAMLKQLHTVRNTQSASFHEYAQGHCESDNAQVTMHTKPGPFASWPAQV